MTSCELELTCKSALQMKTARVTGRFHEDWLA